MKHCAAREYSIMMFSCYYMIDLILNCDLTPRLYVQLVIRFFDLVHEIAESVKTVHFHYAYILVQFVFLQSLNNLMTNCLYFSLELFYIDACICRFA
jgi:hypothetical protein